MSPVALLPHVNGTIVGPIVCHCPLSMLFCHGEKKNKQKLQVERTKKIARQ